jgi:Domain of unknown function (DUF932)
VLGVVGDRYRIVQNDEAFQFVDQLIGSAMHFETAGRLHGGRQVWVLARLPEHIEVGGDPVRCYVLLLNSHDGTTAVVAASTPVRVVCQNTLNWALTRAHQRYSIRHTEKIRETSTKPVVCSTSRSTTTSSSSAPATSLRPSDSPRPRYAACSTSSTPRVPTIRRATEHGGHERRPSIGLSSCSFAEKPRATRRAQMGRRQRNHRAHRLFGAAGY